MAKSILEIEADVWARMAQICQGPYKTSVHPDNRQGTLVGGVWVAEGESRSGLCTLVGWVCRKMELFDGELDYVLYVITKKITKYGDSHNCGGYFWPRTIEGWEARRQFCLEQERICRGQLLS